MDKDELIIKDDLNDKPISMLKKIGFNILLYGALLLIGSVCVWVIKQGTVENQKLIIFFMLSLLLDIVVLVLFFYRGVGVEVLRRLKNQKLYQSGDYVNTLHIMKSGVVKERFVKIDPQTQSFKMKDQPYILNPECIYIYKNMKTYFHADGYPAPIKMKQDAFVNELSCPEMDKVMYSASNFDLKAWIEKHKMLFIIIMGVIMIGILVTGFKVFNIDTVLKEGSYNADNIVNAVRILCVNQSQTIQSIPIG